MALTSTMKEQEKRKANGLKKRDRNETEVTRCKNTSGLTESKGKNQISRSKPYTVSRSVESEHGTYAFSACF